MPLFLDRHDLPGLTAEDLAKAHSADARVQDKYGVCYHTYWFDPDTGSVFCLAEGPDRDSLEAVHKEAHGEMASVIVEIDPNVPLNELLGARPSHPVGTAYAASALRAIMFTDVCGSVSQTNALGDEGHMVLLRQHDAIVRAELEAHDGREVKHTGDGIMASFNSVASAVAAGIAMQRVLGDRNTNDDTSLHVSIGITAGEPITDEREDLFGAAVQLAARLCDAAGAGDIVVSLAVREMCMGKAFQFEERAPIPLKGMPDPTMNFAVAWQS